MSKHHGTETLTFEGYNGYYSSVPQGYGGLIWSDVDYLNASYWQNVKTEWCDTGYQNVVDGNGLAYTWGLQGSPSYGYFRSENIKETFSLASMVAASAWETNQPFKFISYVYEAHVGFVKKASVTLMLSQTPQTIDFTHLSVPTQIPNPFGNISALVIKSGSGSYGNTCSYGVDQPTSGNQMAFDDLTITWNGAVPHKAGPAVLRPLLANMHQHGTPAAHLVNTHAQHADNGSAAPHQDLAGHHTQLASLPAHDASGLTSQFHLPSVEHFGS